MSVAGKAPFALRLRQWAGKRLGRRAKEEASTGLTAEAGARRVAERITEEKAFLLNLVPGIEAEFLATGDGLARLSKHLGEIQQACEELADLTVSDGHDTALQFAFQLLKKAEDLVLASYEQYDHVFATFRELESRLEEIARQRDELMRVLLPLRFITMSFRIEAARHPEQVREAFFTLGESVDQTIAEVRSTMERQFSDIAASEGLAKRVIGQIAESVRAHRSEVAGTLETCRDQLRALTQSLSGSGAGASGLAELNRAAKRHIGVIVVAQQCQDIARQQIEHVGEALDDIGDHLRQTNPDAGGLDSEIRHFVEKAGQLQLRHVANVFEQLESAARDIGAGMAGLRSEAASAAETAVRVGGMALDETVAERCQTGIGELLGILRQAVQKIADILEAFKPLQASFVDCTGKATLLAEDVGYAGLNAQIFAVHAPNGATLEVLAGRVRGVSEEVVRHVGTMGAALSHTTQLVENLKQRLEDFQVLALAEESVLARESDDTRERLAGLKARIPQLIEKVSSEQQAFAAEVETILAHVHFPELVRAANVRASEFFRELVAWGGAVEVGHEVRAGAARRIESLRANYTMESERAAHDAAVVVGAVTAAAAATESPAGDIELFDSAPAADTKAPEDDVVLFDAPVSESVEPEAAAAGAFVEAESKPKPAESAALGDNVELF